LIKGITADVNTPTKLIAVLRRICWDSTSGFSVGVTGRPLEPPPLSTVSVPRARRPSNGSGRRAALPATVLNYMTMVRPDVL
jgi:hypothetical protein